MGTFSIEFHNKVVRKWRCFIVTFCGHGRRNELSDLSEVKDETPFRAYNKSSMVNQAISKALKILYCSNNISSSTKIICVWLTENVHILWWFDYKLDASRHAFSITKLFTRVDHRNLCVCVYIYIIIPI